MVKGAAEVPQLITDWDSTKISNFGRAPLLFHHHAHLDPLFDDDHLAALIEKSPRDAYYVNTSTAVGRGERPARREGEFGGLAGRDILRAVQKGRLWILLLNPEKTDPAYGQLLKHIYDEIQTRVPGFHVKKKKISILVSSPGIPVYYHCDLAGQTLWQVRGVKTVYVYPSSHPYLPQDNLEKIVLNEAHEISLPYRDDWDAAAEIFRIGPGEMLHWPLNAPHRVQNEDSFNVSFTTEHVTADVRRNYVVNFANGILRRTLHMKQLSRGTVGPTYWAKYATMAAARVLRLQKGREQTFKVDFAVDPAAPEGFRDIPLYEFRK